MKRSVELACRCGTVAWRVAAGARGTCVQCFCADCQTYARHLGQAAAVLDPAGGTTLFQTLPDRVAITRGAARLAVLRLGPRGILRWHTGCCATPVANTLPKPAVPFAGLVLPPRTTAFGPVAARTFTAHARRPVTETGVARAGWGVVARAISGRLAGAHRRSPFFDAAGAPVAEPRVLSRAERDAARPR